MYRSILFLFFFLKWVIASRPNPHERLGQRGSYLRVIISQVSTFANIYLDIDSIYDTLNSLKKWAITFLPAPHWYENLTKVGLLSRYCNFMDVSTLANIRFYIEYRLNRQSFPFFFEPDHRFTIHLAIVGNSSQDGYVIQW